MVAVFLRAMNSRCATHSASKRGLSGSPPSPCWCHPPSRAEVARSRRIADRHEISLEGPCSEGMPCSLRRSRRGVKGSPAVRQSLRALR